MDCRDSKSEISLTSLKKRQSKAVWAGLSIMRLISEISKSKKQEAAAAHDEDDKEEATVSVAAANEIGPDVQALARKRLATGRRYASSVMGLYIRTDCFSEGRRCEISYLNLTSLHRVSITVAPPKECPMAAILHRSIEFWPTRDERRTGSVN